MVFRHREQAGLLSVQPSGPAFVPPRKAGHRIRLYVELKEPVDQTREYDRAIAMLEMSIGDEIVIDGKMFCQLVRDEWDWSDEFLLTNSTYSGTAQRISTGG